MIDFYTLNIFTFNFTRKYLRIKCLWTWWPTTTTGLARHTHCCNSSMNIMRLTKHSLNRFNSLYTRWYPYLAQVLGLRACVYSVNRQMGKHINIILLSEHTINNFLMTYRSMHFSALRREASVCRTWCLALWIITRQGTGNNQHWMFTHQLDICMLLPSLRDHCGMSGKRGHKRQKNKEAVFFRCIRVGIHMKSQWCDSKLMPSDNSSQTKSHHGEGMKFHP